MIKFITGLPGAGKSLRAVQLIAEELAKGRNVYVYGLNGLDADLGPWEPLENPNDWQDLPDGSLVVIDEAQKVWPQRRAGDPAPYIRALSEHRHRGFDFIIVTQHPSMVDKYVRTLAGEHQHVLRQFGLQTAKLVTWSECYDDPQSPGTRARGTETLWRYPASLYTRYKSATLHTVKARVPFRLKAIPVLVVLALVAAWFGFKSVTNLATVDPTASAQSYMQGDVVPTAGGVSGSARAAAGQAIKFSTPGEYAEAHSPRIGAKPWSARVFDGRSPVAQPELYCASSETGRCICHTEQGTRYRIERQACHDIVANGLYNPYRVPTLPQQQREPERTKAERPATVPAVYEARPPIAVRDTQKYPPQSSPFTDPARRAASGLPPL